MRPRQSLPAGLGALAERQAGVLTTRQLIDGGLTRAVVRRMAAGWVHACEGIHLTGRVTWEAAAWAGLLRGGPTAVLTEDAAAFLHGVLRDQPTAIAVAAAGKRSGFTVGSWSIVFRRGTSRPMGSPPRVGVELALVSLASRTTEDAAVAAVARALAQGRTTPERILRQLGARRRTRHSSVLTELCGEAARGIESALEWRFAHVMLRHGLPQGERQAVRGRTRIDVLHHDHEVVIELDGVRDHADWSKDMLRDNARLIESGAMTLRYGWNAVTGDPCLVAAQVGAALRLRGWPGTLRRCPRCTVTSW